MMAPAVLDTDTLSEVLKQRSAVVNANAAAYFKAHGEFCISAVTRFELIRGCKAAGATAQLARFDIFCQNSLVLPITDAIFDRAAELWVLGRRQGFPHGDADLLIAATTLEYGRTLVTGNRAHFSWIPGLSVIDWRVPQA